MVNPKTFALSAAQVAAATKLGIPLHEFAQATNNYYEIDEDDGATLGVIEEEEGEDEQDYDPNNDPIYSAPIENLRGMWIARFGDKWVLRYDDIEDDSEWEKIRSRLVEYDMLEEDHTCEWLKIKEDRK
jgi:hypothetical protein